MLTLNDLINSFKELLTEEQQKAFEEIVVNANELIACGAVLERIATEYSNILTREGIEHEPLLELYTKYIEEEKNKEKEL